MKTENGFKILASFSGISQVGCRKSLFWSFLRLLDTLHVVGPAWRGGRMGGFTFHWHWGWGKGKESLSRASFQVKSPEALLQCTLLCLRTVSAPVCEALGTKFSSQKQSFSKYLHSMLAGSLIVVTIHSKIFSSDPRPRRRIPLQNRIEPNFHLR